MFKSHSLVHGLMIFCLQGLDNWLWLRSNIRLCLWKAESVNSVVFDDTPHHSDQDHLTYEPALPSFQQGDKRIDVSVCTENILFTFHGDNVSCVPSHSCSLFVCISEPPSGPLCDCPLPTPEMSFHLWTENLDICEWKFFASAICFAAF